jgi:hypothetical protein
MFFVNYQFHSINIHDIELTRPATYYNVTLRRARVRVTTADLEMQ